MGGDKFVVRIVSHAEQAVRPAVCTLRARSVRVRSVRLRLRVRVTGMCVCGLIG